MIECMNIVIGFGPVLITDCSRKQGDEVKAENGTNIIFCCAKPYARHLSYKV